LIYQNKKAIIFIENRTFFQKKSLSEITSKNTMEQPGSNTPPGNRNNKYFELSK